MPQKLLNLSLHFFSARNFHIANPEICTEISIKLYYVFCCCWNGFQTENFFFNAQSSSTIIYMLYMESFFTKLFVVEYDVLSLPILYSAQYFVNVFFFFIHTYIHGPFLWQKKTLFCCCKNDNKRLDVTFSWLHSSSM
jgi:hypothetical protein